MSRVYKHNSKKNVLKSCIILKCKIPFHHVPNWIKFKTDKLFYFCCARGKYGLSTPTMFAMLLALGRAWQIMGEYEEFKKKSLIY